MEKISEISLKTAVGYNGMIKNGLAYLENGKYLVYSIGLAVIIKNLHTLRQVFLHGHSDIITCLSVSHNEKYIASGQQSKSRGNKVPIIVWDLEAIIQDMELEDTKLTNDSTKYSKYHLVLHMGKVQDLTFSCNDTYLYSIGGQDDNALISWNIETGEPICGTPASEDSTLCLESFHQHNELLVSTGNYSIIVWRLDAKHRKFYSLTTNIGNLKRIVTCITVTSNDEFCYCGTKTGDILEIALDCDLTKINCTLPPIGNLKPRYLRSSKERFSEGITTIASHCFTKESGERGGHRENAVMVFVGAGDGTLALLKGTNTIQQELKAMPTIQVEKLLGSVTSISRTIDIGSKTNQCYVGTNQANVYIMKINEDKGQFYTDLSATCHYGSITDLIYPRGRSAEENSEIFLTCSLNDIRIWNAKQMYEILRIQIPTIICNCVDLTYEGTTIVSGWNDGKIRAFFPESAKLKFIIQDAHSESVTAIATCYPEANKSNEWRIVSGGFDGRIRVWRITPTRQAMDASLKEHRGPVNSIQVLRDNSACVSASSDGSCIVWNLKNCSRMKAMFASTIFRRILYHPDESQMITCGSDRRITYYDSYDGEAIRILEEAGQEEILSLDIDTDGLIFVTGGRDSLLKIWHYDNGEVIAVGHGHSEAINCAKIAPNGKSVTTVGSDGSILVWDIREIYEKVRDSASDRRHDNAQALEAK